MFPVLLGLLRGCLLNNKNNACFKCQTLHGLNLINLCLKGLNLLWIMLETMAGIHSKAGLWMQTLFQLLPVFPQRQGTAGSTFPLQATQWQVAFIWNLSKVQRKGIKTLVLFSDWYLPGNLSLTSCESKQIADWYTIFFNPKPDYVNTLHCTQEAVYPL